MRDLSFEFSLPDEDVHGFAMGHMEISGIQNTITSELHSPSQAMMIFHSIGELLDGIRRLLNNPDESQYEFVGTDSSFHFLVDKTGSGLTIRTRQTVIMDTISEKQLVEALWLAISTFLEDYQTFLVSDDVVAKDLRGSIELFKTVFDL